MVIDSRQKLLAESHDEINIKIEDQVISKVDHTKSLGLINELCIRPLISQSTAVLN